MRLNKRISKWDGKIISINLMLLHVLQIAHTYIEALWIAAWKKVSGVLETFTRGDCERERVHPRVIDAHAMHRVSFYDNFAILYSVVFDKSASLRVLIEIVKDIW